MEKILYTNGTIYTMEHMAPLTEAVLIQNGSIIATGKKQELQSKAQKIIDLEGATMLPAFLDAHSHLMGVANGLLQVDLSEVYSFAEIKTHIQQFIKQNGILEGEWVLAQGLNHANLQEQQLPTKSFLDEIAPKHCLILQHASGHSAVCNTLGLTALGVTEQTPQETGGRIVYDTGVLEEQSWVTRIQLLPLPTMEMLFTAFAHAQKIYASYGYTTIQEGLFVSQLKDIYGMLMKQKKLWLDVVSYMDLQHESNLIDAFPLCKNQYHNHHKVGGYKILLDGSPQSKTAWLSQPYTDGSNGYPMMTDKELLQYFKIAIEQQQQLLVHANGDAAIEQYLHVYDQAKQCYGEVVRPVLIHAQTARIDQIEKMTNLGVIPSFFLAHIYHWGDTHIKNMGVVRANEISPAHTALSYGLHFTLHQDSPVIPPNSIETLWCAVERKTKQHQILGGHQKLTPYEALKAMTLHAAIQYGEEDKKGSIRMGKYADFVIFDKNPMEIETEEWKTLHILKTIKQGNVIYEK